MNIAYVCSDPGVPLFGVKGASIHVRELTRALHELGHDVTVFAARTGDRAPAGYDVPVVTGGLAAEDEGLLAILHADPAAGDAARDVRAMVAAAVLRERALPILRSNPPDFVYERLSLFGTAGTAIARRFGVPLVVEVNSPLSDEQAQHRWLTYRQAAGAIEHDVLRSADLVIAVSTPLRRWLTAIGVDSEGVTVLTNGVDPARFVVSARDRDRTRGRLGVGDTPVVGFVGTLKRWHDVATLVRAVAIVRRTTEAVLVVVGDGPERERLEELARSEGTAGAVTFTGLVPNEEVAPLLAAFDVAVAPSAASTQSYFSPLKLMEYLAAGRPTIAADVGDVRHCIRHGDTGLLYPAGDAGALAAALGELLVDHDRAGAIGARGRDHVRAQHTWERNARRVVELAQRRCARHLAEVGS